MPGPIFERLAVSAENPKVLVTLWPEIQAMREIRVRGRAMVPGIDQPVIDTRRRLHWGERQFLLMTDTD
jgi:hypothetical protein